jgi:hypothetical protein
MRRKKGGPVMGYFKQRGIENEDLSRVAEEVAIRTGHLALARAVLPKDAADEIIEELRFREKQVALRPLQRSP